MKLVCTVAVANRIQTTFSSKSDTKHVKSTLAICKHPKNENDFMIIHFSLQNKTGTKYKLSNNVSNVLTRFVHEGKATIQFKEPSYNLFIKADVLQLKSFLHLLRRALENKIPTKELTLSSMSVTAVSQKNIPPKKLVIKNRSEIPIRGFPRTLEYLYINEISLAKLNIGVLQLQKLRVLDISDNCIEFLPVELNKLPLEELNVAKNKLGNSSLKQWAWIGGPLLRSLRILNLSNNELKFLPEQLVKFQGLIKLLLDDNNIASLPRGFGNYRNLRILTVSNNNLTHVPGSMKRLHLETLNLSNNNFLPISVAAVFPKNLPVCSLKEYAGRKVLVARLAYTAETIPYTLVDYLDYAYYCICGRPCFEVHLHHSNVLMIKSITQSFVSKLGDLNYIPMDCYYCSTRCLRRVPHPNIY